MEIMLMELSFQNNSLKLQNVMKRTRLHLEERELRNTLVSRQGMHHCVASWLASGKASTHGHLPIFQQVRC